MAKEDNVKKFAFTSDELNFLAIRQEIINLHATTVNDIRSVLESYILNTVVSRIGLDPSKYEVSYNIVKNEIYFTPKIVLPENGQLPATNPIIKTPKS